MNITYRVRGDKHDHGEGFGIWLSEINPYAGIDSPIKDVTTPKIFGMAVT